MKYARKGVGIRVGCSLIRNITRILLGFVGRGNDRVLLVQRFIRMIRQRESIPGRDRATVRRTGCRSNLAVKSLHRILDGRLAVVKDLVQFASLLSAALV